MRSKFKWIFTLLVALSMQFSFAQEKTVTGVVSDAGGPLPGANVVVKGTTNGVSTDVDGKYAIKAKTGATLVFSFVGLADKSVVVGASNTINATLAPDAKMLDEVVVTSLGITKKSGAITSSNQVVKTQELNQAAAPNAVQALIGKVSGLQINTTNSGVNPSTRIVLRNNKTISGNNQALIVIDGVISTSGAFSSLDPGTIESVNVVKGAQGAALYGSDGSTGVIIVTTKKGSGSDKMKVSVSSSLDFEDISFLPARQTRYGQGWNGQNVSYENGAWGAEFDGTMVAVGLPQADGSYIMAPYSSRGSDNIKDFFKTGVFTQNRVSIASGSLNDGYFYFAAEKQARDFVVDGDRFDKKNFLLKAGRKLGKITFEGNVGYTNQVTSQANSFLYDDLIQTATNIPVSEFANSGMAGHWSVYTANPYWTIKNNRSDGSSDTFNGIAKLQYDVNKNINVVYNTNVRVVSSDNRSYTNAYVNAYAGTVLYDNSVGSTFSTSSGRSRSIYADLLLNFNYDLTDNLNLKFNLGNNVQDQWATSVGVGGNNLAIDGLYNIGFLNGDPNFGGGGVFNTSSRLRKYSYFGQVDLAYKDFLFLNLTGRNDWASIFSEANNNYFYPSAGLSFVATDAFDGLKSDTFNNAKIYANYTKVGQTGALGPYSINSLYSATAGYPFNGVGSYLQNTASTDPNIRPEFFTTKEIGINLAFFKNRLTLDAAAFRTDTKDLITNITPSFTSGFTSTTVNIGAANTKGFEVDLGFTPIDYKGFKWTNRLSYSTSKMIVTKVSDQQDRVQVSNGYAATANYNVGIFAEEGEQFPLIKGYAYQRDEEGRVIVDASNGSPLYTSDYVKLGVANPDYILGYNTSFEYKGIRLVAVMDYRKGGEFYSQTMNRLSTFGYLVESAQGGRTGFVFPNSSYEDPSNPGSYIANTSVVTGGTSYSSYINYNNNNFTEVAENFVLDATAFKVRELALSYSFSKELLNDTMLESLVIGVNARNPFIKLPKANRGYADPEASVTSGNAQGFQYTGQYPNTRSVGFSLNLTF